jgi:DNA polymerase III delta prime subunit
MQLFLSYAAEDRQIGEQIYLALLGAGHHVFFDRESLPPGGDYHARIRSAVKESDVLLFLVSPDSVVDGSYALTELKYARNKWPHPKDKVIPVILRSTVWDKIPNYLKSVTVLEPEGNIAAEVVNAVADLEGRNPPDSEAPRSKVAAALLKEVKGEVTDRVTQSLHYAVLKLLKETSPQEVRRPWDVEVKVTTQQSVLLAPDTEIIQVFDEKAIAGKLLILGAPGAGKTTTLLQLAEELVKRAEADTLKPMPVLMNLTYWKDDSQTIASSLVDRMHEKYGIRKDISQHWLDERSLLPLLDGLDELEPARQEKCVQAINEFQQAFRPEQLVVCCRLAEYQNCQTKLQLNGAVHLQPLTDEQIHHYLISGQHPELWNEIQTAPELLELARSPLLLSMMALVYEKGRIESKDRLDPTHEGRKYLFDQYIERMLSRATNDQQYPRAKTLHWLAWLARGLHSHAQTEFLLETLQPSWLQSLAQKLTYRICVFLIVVMFVLVSLSLFHWMGDFVPKGQLEIMFIQTIGPTFQETIGTRSETMVKWISIIIALIAGLIIGLKRTIKPIETLKWSGAKARTGMALGLRRWSIGGLKYGAYTGQIVGLVIWVIWALSSDMGASMHVELAQWGRSGQIAGGIFGLMAGVATLLIAQSSLWRVEELWDWRMIRSAEVLISGLIVGLAVGLTLGTASGANVGLLAGGFSGLGIGLIAGLSRGQSNSLNFRVADGVIAGLIGWLMYGVLTWFIGRQLLKGFEIELSRWMEFWLLSWLGIGVIAGLAAGLIAKLSATAESVETRQGAGIESWGLLALRWRRWLLAGAAAALVAGLVLGLVMGLGTGLNVQAIAVFFTSFGLSLNTMLGFPVSWGLLGAALGVWVGAIQGALIGSLAGLTGPDVERRTMPNQGIRQAAANAGRFALIGGLVLGSIYALWNLVQAVLVTGLAPDSGTGLASGWAGCCIWHYSLRWCQVPLAFNISHCALYCGAMA